MSERIFSRRRRGGHRFRPSGGMSPNIQRTDRAASDARAEALGEKPSEESVFDRARHEREIQRAENLAAGLHYWDIVPSTFDSSVEIVEREGRRRDRPRITQRDIPRLYPPGSEIIVQVTKGPIGTKGPRVTTNLALPGRYLVLLPNSDQSGISRKIDI